jgi:hypothetical protein
MDTNELRKHEEKKLFVGQAVYERKSGDTYFITGIEQRDTTWHYQIDGKPWYSGAGLACKFDVQFSELH